MIRGLPSERIPRVLLMAMCHEARLDAATGYTDLLATFRVLHAPRLPWTWPTLTLFVVLTDALGNYDLVVDLYRHRDELAITHIEVEGVHIPDPRGVIEMPCRCHDVTLDERGAYSFRLSINGVFCESATFGVDLLESPPGA
jgi:hypothetical protein